MYWPDTNGVGSPSKRTQKRASDSCWSSRRTSVALYCGAAGSIARTSAASSVMWRRLLRTGRREWYRRAATARPHEAPATAPGAPPRRLLDRRDRGGRAVDDDSLGVAADRDRDGIAGRRQRQSADRRGRRACRRHEEGQVPDGGAGPHDLDDGSRDLDAVLVRDPALDRLRRTLDHA